MGRRCELAGEEVAQWWGIYRCETEEKIIQSKLEPEWQVQGFIYSSWLSVQAFFFQATVAMAIPGFRRNVQHYSSLVIHYLMLEIITTLLPLALRQITGHME
ncbi:unnamed protein product [Prunus brigantina]